uniref:Uncharacterized protein n=1 Tax=Anguilla anguilla TaxID=7936 RepID=A0A0E9T3Q6_ANGAN
MAWREMAPRLTTPTTLPPYRMPRLAPWLPAYRPLTPCSVKTHPQGSCT